MFFGSCEFGNKNIIPLSLFQIVEDISAGISQTVEAEFTEFAQNTFPPHSQQQSLLTNSLTVDHWQEYIRLSRASILSRCSKAAAKLGGASEETQSVISRFCEYWTYLYYLSEESDTDPYLAALFTNEPRATQECQQLVLQYQAQARSVLNGSYCCSHIGLEVLLMSAIFLKNYSPLENYPPRDSCNRFNF